MPAAPNYVPSRGPLDAKIMVVGEAPGQNEDRLRQPFVGPAGQLLDEAMTSVGIDITKVRYTNLYRYKPLHNDLRPLFTATGQPEHPSLLEGLVELRDEIALIQPNVIIPLGNYPLRILTGNGKWDKDSGYTGIGNYRGSILEGRPFAAGRKCVPTYHPAAVLRQYSLKHILRHDLRRASEQAEFPEIRRPRKHIVLDPRGGDREAWATWLAGPVGMESPGFRWAGESTDAPLTHLPASSFLSFDIEYIGSRLLCVGFTRHADAAITFRTRDAADRDFVRGILLSGVPLCAQNAMFDCSILEWFYDIPCLQFLQHDTMIGMHAAYIEMPKDLGFIGSLFTEQPVWWDKSNWKSEAWYTSDAMLQYNAIDVWVTHAAMEGMLADELTDSAILRTYQHEMRLIQPLWDMSRFGVRVDRAALERLRSTLETEIADGEQALRLINSSKDVNVKSSPQVAKLLYSTLGIVPDAQDKTPGGAWKMNDDTLAKILLGKLSPIQKTAVTLIRNIRERRDLISKFCEIELDDDNRMRCHYDPAKTTTGRLSSRKFYPTGRGTNLQNQPRDSRVRAVFVPDKGYTFGYADLKSAESLVVAHITGDKEMLRLHSPEYMTGLLDGHKFVASYLLGKPIEEVTKDDRYLGKRIRHAGNYGISWHRLMTIINADAQVTGVSVTAAQAKKLINGYRQLHPGLLAWWREVETTLWATRTLQTCHGRKRVFYDRPSAILPEAIAYNPQGTVADTLNIGLARTSLKIYTPQARAHWDEYEHSLYSSFQSQAEELAGLGFHSLIQVHDAIAFQAPAQHMDRVCELVAQCMAVEIPVTRRGVEPYAITIPVEIQVGENWGEAGATNPGGLKTWRQ